jgi:hypothetical protein
VHHKGGSFVSVKGSATVKSAAVVSIPVSDQERAKAYHFAWLVCAAVVANSLAGTVWLLRPKQIAVAAATSPDAACCEAAA